MAAAEMDRDGGLERVFADLHLHIGSTDAGQPVKISASRDLTFHRIAQEASGRKGIRLLGVIDAHAPGVQADIARLLDSGEMAEIAGGGIRYRDVTLLLGSEIEIREEGRAPAHYLVYLPDLAAMRSLTDWMSKRMRNINLSSQRLYAGGRVLQEEIRGRGGLFIPAHIFTPHKGLFGSSADRLPDVLDPASVDGAELGLSADTEMAGYLPDLDTLPFLTNSDAHSLAKIGREYNALLMGEPSFAELRMALKGLSGRRIAANYGLNPKLGKYHRTSCLNCGTTLAEHDPPAVARCPQCGSERIVRGVLDRILALGEQSGRPAPVVYGDRPPYVYQVPLEFVPGVGRRTMDKLLERFGTEMAVLHEASKEALAACAGEQAAMLIDRARRGELALTAGGGGVYGRVGRE